uniref:Uncharacterized protein n=1 Tax=Leptobrachium leishanense TaxID=445787 RepID=A0A8C5RD65_9ANUR
MAELTSLLLFSAVLSVISPGKGGILSSPGDVHFVLDFPQLLTWSPGNSTIQDITYEVEYSGNDNETWKPIPHCSPTFNLTCDLTAETLSEEAGYNARVRSVFGSHTSDWVSTHWDLYTFKDDSIPVPQDVHFDLDFFHHVLKWSPGNSNMDVISYEVEYLIYGNGKWKPVPHCSPTLHLNCDLIEETLSVDAVFFGRVRSVSGNQTSDWVQTTRYTRKDIKLSPPSFQLQEDGNVFIVQLRLPEIRLKNVEQHFQDIFPFFRMYTVYVRRTSDNHTIQKEKGQLLIHIDDLARGKEYCVSAKTSITSRENTAIVSEESCIWLPKSELGSNMLVIIASSILAVVAFMILINIFICLYLRKRVKTPPALKSLIMRSWSWMEKPPTPIAEGKISLHWENDFIDHLLSESRNSLMHRSADSGFGSQILTEKCTLPLDPLLKHIEDDTMKSNPAENVDTDKMIQIEDIPITRQKSEGDDSGISLSADSPYLGRSYSRNGAIHDTDIEGSGETSHHLLEREEVGYLKQQMNKEIHICEEDKDTQNVWQSEMIDYLKQGPKKHLGHSDLQEQCEDFQGPWTQLSEGFSSTVPLTPVFSPFSRILLDLGVCPLSLGDVEIMEVGS